MVCRPVADSYRCRPAIMHDLCDRTALLLKEGGSGADRIVGAIRSGVRDGDAAYAAMTCREITAGFDRHGIGIANWRL